MKNNEKIEVLSEKEAVPFSKNDFSNENLRTINTNEVVSEQVDTIDIDSNSNIDMISFDYNDYITDLSKIYSTTTFDNSITSTFIVENNTCNHSITIKDSSGVNTTKRTNSFKYNEEFIYSFLIPMVNDYAKNNTIFDSTIEVLDEDRANFIVRTKSNDSLILIGIDIELANKMKDIINNLLVLNESISLEDNNEYGISNTLAIVVAIIGIAIAIIGIITFTIINSK